MCLVLLLLSLEITPLLQRGVAAGEPICEARGVRAFYERRAMEPAWSDASIASLQRAIDALASEGLAPYRYHRDAIARATGAARDVLATDAFLAAAAHLSAGVVDPEFARPAWCAPSSPLDVAAILEAALADGTIEESLAILAPRHEGYVRLRRMLAAYRAVEWPLVPAGPSLRRGSDDPRVIPLRKRLGATGASSVFDHDLETLVRHFQSHHGIVVDGIVGPETLAELNVPASQRAQQIAVNMERWRWMPQDPGARHILVNVAAFRVDVIEGARSRLSMNAVVGKEFTKTPFFAAKLTDIVLNPWWNVPDSIARKELWPKQRRDPSYFAREHMVVTNGRIRQRPGPWNALGRIKFNLPNRYDVYLHDTPSKSLFERAFRAFSHGCIRVQEPRDLALLLLEDQPQWTAERIDATIEAGVERSVPLKTPVPVFVLYWTALVGDDGHMEFYRDHYGEDAAIAAALQ